MQEDLQLVVPVLDAFSNMNLEPELFDQVNNLKLVDKGFSAKIVLLASHLILCRDLISSYVTCEERC